MYAYDNSNRPRADLSLIQQKLPAPLESQWCFTAQHSLRFPTIVPTLKNYLVVCIGHGIGHVCICIRLLVFPPITIQHPNSTPGSVRMPRPTERTSSEVANCKPATDVHRNYRTLISSPLTLLEPGDSHQRQDKCHVIHLSPSVRSGTNGIMPCVLFV